MQIPIELKESLPRLALELADRRIILFLAIVAYTPFLFLWSIKLRVLDAIAAPALGPLLAAVYMTVHPMNPYEFAWVERRSSEVHSDDPVAQRLLRLLRSTKARNIVWTTAVATSITFLAIVLLTSAVFSSGSKPREGSLFGHLVFAGIWALLSLNLIYHFLLRWAFREWRSER